MTDEPTGRGDRTLQVLRQRVLGVALTLLGWGMPAVALTVLGPALANGNVGPWTWGASAFTFLFPALSLGRRQFSFRTATLILLVLMLVAAFMLEVRQGVTFGAALLDIVLLQMAALLLDRSWAIRALILVLLAMTLAGTLKTLGLVSSPPAILWSPEFISTWIRSAIGFAVLGGTISAANIFVVQSLEAEAASLRASLNREALERSARERAERERQRSDATAHEAQAALADGQRLEALGRLAGGIAHDFNNALVVILGAASVLRDDPALSAESVAMVEDLEGAAQRAAQLTRELLTLGRRDVVHREIVDVDEFMTRIVASARRAMASDYQIELNAGSGGRILIDPLQFDRAVLNLLLNARDAMPVGGRIVVTTGIENDATGPRVVVRVRDFGPGIDPETRAHMFEPFFTTKKKGKGIGLGLSLVRTIADEAHAAISVESTPGQGTTFVLSFPRSAEDAVEPGEGMAPQTTSRRDDAAPEGSIAVVEDRPDVRSMLVRTLSREGYAVVEAANGDEALRLLGDSDLHLDLLCIDAVMPGTATAIVIERFLERRPEMRVLILSGHVEEDLLRRGIATGQYAFLAKPFQLDELRDRVRGLIRGPETTPGVPKPQ